MKCSNCVPTLEDDQELISLGYAQQFYRGLTSFMSFAYSLTVCAIVPGIALLFSFSLTTGGPRSWSGPGSSSLSAVSSPAPQLGGDLLNLPAGRLGLPLDGAARSARLGTLRLLPVRLDQHDWQPRQQRFLALPDCYGGFEAVAAHLTEEKHKASVVTPPATGQHRFDYFGCPDHHCHLLCWISTQLWISNSLAPHFRPPLIPTERVSSRPSHGVRPLRWCFCCCNNFRRCWTASTGLGCCHRRRRPRCRFPLLEDGDCTSFDLLGSKANPTC